MDPIQFYRIYFQQTGPPPPPGARPEMDQARGMEGSEREAGIGTRRRELTSIYISYTSCSPTLLFRLPYATRVAPFGTIQVEKGVGNGGKESKRGKRRRRT